MRALSSFMRRLERRLGAKLAQRERNRGAAVRAALRATPEFRAAADVAGGNVAIIIRSPLGTVEHTLEPDRELLVGSNGASINRPASLDGWAHRERGDRLTRRLSAAPLRWLDRRIDARISALKDREDARLAKLTRDFRTQTYASVRES